MGTAMTEQHKLTLQDITRAYNDIAVRRAVDYALRPNPLFERLMKNYVPPTRWQRLKLSLADWRRPYS